MRPPPEKWHGLTDHETRYRQRYVDLGASLEVREIFRRRTNLIAGIRRFLDDHDFIEVETPVLHKPEEAGGAVARPFQTHHNALDLDLKLRIALELHLKRLIVGGLERVYEIGRVFRNEGIDRRHNPEFTMLEVYQAYSDYRGMMTLIHDLLISLIRDVVRPADGSLKIKHAASGQEIDFAGEWREVKYKDLISDVTYHEEVDEVTGLSRKIVVDSPDEKKQPLIEVRDKAGKVTRKYHMPSHAHLMVEDGDVVYAGAVLAKIPRETTKTKDITGGLPRVVELFEANGEALLPCGLDAQAWRRRVGWLTPVCSRRRLVRS